MKKYLFLLFALIASIGCSLAQTDVGFIHSKVADSTKVTKPTGWGTIYYSFQQNKWKIVENGVTYDLKKFGGSGGGISNSAGTNEVPKFNGTSFVPSGLFNPSAGVYNFGTGSSGATRSFNADGSASNVGFSFVTKGASAITLKRGDDTNTNGWIFDSTNGLIQLDRIGSSTQFTYFRGITGTASHVNGDKSYFRGGDAYSVGNTNGGDVDLSGGVQHGSGTPGDVYIQNNPLSAGSGKISFFSATPVVKQSAVTTSQGLADALTAYGLIPSSTISGGGGSGTTLTPTAVKTSNYTAVVGDLVKCDVTTGFTVTLPPAPADKSEILVKIVAPATVTNTLTIATGGSDVFNVTSGSTSLSLTQKFQSVWLQYQSTGSIWIVKTTDAAGLATKVNQGTAYAEVGVLLDELFPGSTLNATNWSGSLPTGASISSKLIIASGLSDWTRYIQLQKFFPFEKETFEIYFKAVTKNSGDAWGLSQNLTLLASGNQSIYIKFDQSNGANSGMLSMGSTTAANEYGYSQALTWSSGDQLKLTIQKKPGKAITILENITTPSALKAYGDFPVDIRTTGGQYKLSFLGGQQEFSEFKVTSNCRNFGGTFGVVFIGDSQTNGSGNTDFTFRWASLLMKNQSHLFEVLGISTWSTTTFTAARVTEFLSGIAAKYLVINLGYNDYQFNSGAPATYEAALETVITTAQGLGYTVVVVSMVPAFTGADNTSFDTQTALAATNTGARYINNRAILSTGVKLNPNYVNSDGIHLNDDGALVMANNIKTTANDLYSQFLIDFNNADIRANSLPVEKSTIALVGIGDDNRFYRVDQSNYLNKNSAILYQGTLRAQQTGSIGITGKFVYGGTLQQINSASQGFQLGYNDGTSGSTSTNIDITNAGNGGVGFPQAYANITGLRNIEILALSSAGKLAADHTISGNDNILMQANLGGSAINLSGSGNIIIGTTKTLGAVTTAHHNIGIGTDVLKGMGTQSYNIQISDALDISANNYGLPSSSQQGTIMIGTPFDLNIAGFEDMVNGETAINAYGTGQRIFTFGPKGGQATSVIWRPGHQGGTDHNGFTLYIDAARGVGAGLPGDIRFRHSISGTTGTALQTTYTEDLILAKTLATFSTPVVASNFAPAFTTTATAAGTTTLTVSSNWVQSFTGGTTQTVVLPVVTTMTNGQGFRIVNTSSGVVTVQTSGANSIKAMAAGSYIDVWVVNTAGGTGTASWNWIYTASINN